MLSVVTGGAASGKSRYAERLLAAQCPGEKYYLAAMQPHTAEDENRIARHRIQRAGLGFVTRECPTALLSLTLPQGCGALLECLSNLLANELFSPDGAGEEAELAILAGLDRLMQTADQLVVVTNELFADGIAYPPSTERYREMLGRLNRAVFLRADLVVEVICGIPLVLKGEGSSCEV